ncbi:Clp protease N-terminal domain-containing protein [Nocardiopsis sp. HNM0947]|uniref:Clp protease N-terminal domain-containing protein n=1 Tax=Nocardiopsis coralli TaxID=2772213 RepID=A0ABR9P6K1_9ACTN|nr:Clp protease N-terminal domain-containing protein [Nocardiopsis coralli]MBE2999446.1 Clp protease N-terminal domain-containing protein [Nocardiopsis coralli]
MVETRESGGQLYLDAKAEALARGDRKVGTDHLLLALLSEERGRAAQVLAEQGVDLDGARRALAALDVRALASVGVRVERADGVARGRVDEKLPLTPGAKAVLKGVGRKAPGGGLGSKVLVRLVVVRAPEPVSALLDELGVDRGVVYSELAER